MQAGDGRVSGEHQEGLRTTAGLRGKDREEVLLADTDNVLTMSRNLNLTHKVHLSL